MTELIHWLQVAPWEQALAVLLAENVAIFLLFWWGGVWLARRFPDRRVALAPLPLGPPRNW